MDFQKTEVDLEHFDETISELNNITYIYTMHNVSSTEKKQDIKFPMV